MGESQSEKIARLETELAAACERWYAALAKVSEQAAELELLRVRSDLNKSIIGKLSQDRADALAERDKWRAKADAWEAQS